MTRLAGNFQTDLPLSETLAACAEAIHGLGWQIESVEGRRIVSYADSQNGPGTPRIQIELQESGEATDIRIIGTDTESEPLNDEELIAELARARDAIEASVEAGAKPSQDVTAEDSVPAAPAGWYPDSRDSSKLRYWDGRIWTDQTHPAPVELPPHKVAPAHPSSRSGTASSPVPQEAPTRSARSSQPSSSQPSRGRRGIRPHWRKMTWVLIIWSALILIWAVSAGGANDCGSEATQLNKDACDAGTGLAVSLILFIGFFGFAFFSLIWFMTRPKGRECPACGERAKKGQTICPACGHDFAAAARTGSPEPIDTG